MLPEIFTWNWYNVSYANPVTFQNILNQYPKKLSDEIKQLYLICSFTSKWQHKDSVSW